MNSPIQECEQGASVNLSSAAAREVTDKIRAGLEGVHQLIIQAYQGRAWSSLGYLTWDEYVRREFGNQSLRPPLEERDQVVQSLRDSGMSVRAIATATQLGRGTVGRVLDDSGVPNGTPEQAGSDTAKVLGIDGKEYSSRKPSFSPPVNSPDSGVLDAVLDAPAEDVGVKVLDSESIGQKRSDQAEKVLSEFHGSDVAVLPKTMFLAEKIGALVSPVSGDIDVDATAYADVAKDIAAALRQFAWVAKTLAGADVEFENRQLLAVVIDDLRFADDYLQVTVSEMEEKK